jgi:hypothetical protein
MSSEKLVLTITIDDDKTELHYKSTEAFDRAVAHDSALSNALICIFARFIEMISSYQANAEFK